MDGSPVSPTDSAKTSSSEWNSSDHLAGPSGERQESGNADPTWPGSPPAVPPKTFGLTPLDFPGVPSPESLRNPPRTGSSPLSHSALRRWIETPPEHRFSSDASSKSGSSDHDRNELSASESDEPAPGPDPPAVALPTTYFSVDGCMTETYRAKYHRPAPAPKAEEHTSSGESDAEGRRPPAADAPPRGPKSRSQPGAGGSGNVGLFFRGR